MNKPPTTVSDQEIHSASFSGLLASVLYDTPANPDRNDREIDIVRRHEEIIKTTNRKKLWQIAPYMDEHIVPMLSGNNLLRFARLLEERIPVIIPHMRNLRMHKEHLERTAELSEILSPASIERLTLAMKKADMTNTGKNAGE